MIERHKVAAFPLDMDKYTSVALSLHFSPRHCMSLDTRLRILIADDHKLVREMLGLLLQNQDEFAVDMAETLPETLERIMSAGEYDIILLDIVMPGMGGLLGVKQVIKANAKGAVVLFSGQLRDSFVQDALSHGARGFIPKNLPPSHFLDALRLVSSGQVFLPPDAPKASQPPPVRAIAELGPQEQRVLSLLCDGLSNKAIARELDLSEASVKSLMRSLCTKIGARNRTEAALIARGD